MCVKAVADGKKFGCELELRVYFDRLRGQKNVKFTATTSDAWDQALTIGTDRSTPKFGTNDGGTRFISFKDESGHVMSPKSSGVIEGLKWG